MANSYINIFDPKIPANLTHFWNMGYAGKDWRKVRQYKDIDLSNLYELAEHEAKTDAKLSPKKPPKKSSKKSSGTFSSAYAEHRKIGEGTEFTYDGKKYVAVSLDDLNRRGLKDLEEWQKREKSLKKLKKKGRTMRPFIAST